MSVPPYSLPSPAVQSHLQRNSSADELDIDITCADGSVWHAWYRGKAGGWIGCEKIAGV